MIDSNQILFLDIETAPVVDDFKDVHPSLQSLFIKKFSREVDLVTNGPGPVPPQEVIINRIWQRQAPIFAEFNQIVCVSVGIVILGGPATIKVKTISRETRSEQQLLEQLASVMEKVDRVWLCAHNGKGFDFPILNRKYMRYGMPIPEQLRCYNKKTWDISWIDTQEIWGASQWKYTVALATLAHLFGLPSPKENMSGEDVPRLYFQGEDRKIAEYCALDTVTLIHVYRALANESRIQPQDIAIVHESK